MVWLGWFRVYIYIYEHVYMNIIHIYQYNVYIYIYIQYLKVEVDVQIHMCTQYISISMHITICGSYLRIHVFHLNIPMAHKRGLPKHGTYLVRFPVYNPHHQLLYPYVWYFTTQPPHTTTPFLGFMNTFTIWLWLTVRHGKSPCY